MAITDQTLELANGMIVSISGQVDEATRATVAAWANSWDTLSAQWESALAQITSQMDAGKWPSQTVIMRMQRVLSALGSTQEQLGQLSRAAGIRVTDALPGLVQEGAQWEALLIASNYPPEAGELSELVLSFNNVDETALSAIVKRSTDDISEYLGRVGPRGEAAIRSLLIQGIALGDNPREVASRMLGRIENAFNGALARTLNIARTEMIDAYRESAYLQDQANKDIMAQWEWSAQLDLRTCPSCWAMHGQRFSIEIKGPWDHQQGRCVRIPVTKSWRELGFNIPEPVSSARDAQSVFRSLPRVEQERVMGKARLDLLNSGNVNWDQLSTFRPSSQWRGSYGPTPVADLVG